MNQETGEGGRCWRCFWPRNLCWCKSIVEVPSRTRFVLLMHPMEFKRVRANTGRLAHLSLPNSEIIMGINFDHESRFQALISDAGRRCVLLYPAATALDLSRDGQIDDDGRALTVCIIDATWAHARKIYRQSSSLQTMATVRFSPASPSRYRIKRQPASYCLSTIECCHDILASLARQGLEDPALDPAPLLALFDRMQAFQMACQEDPSNPSRRSS